MAPLDRAVPFPQVHHLAVTVRQDLHLHMAGAVDEFLQIQPWIAKGCLRLPLGRLKQLIQFLPVGYQAHTPTTTAGGGLDHHRIAHDLRQPGRLGRIRHEALTAGDRGHPHPLHRGLSRGLVSHRPDRLRGGTHKNQPVGIADLSEAIVFRQEAIAGMDGIRPPGGGGGNDVGNI